MLNRKSTSMLFALVCRGAGMAWLGPARYLRANLGSLLTARLRYHRRQHDYVTQKRGGMTTITVNLAPGWAFVNTGANGSGSSLNFGFGSALATLTIINTSSNGWNSTDGQFSVEGGTPNNGSATDTVSTALHQAPANNGNTFSFTNGIAITCNSSGGSSQCGNNAGVDLSFTISTAAALVGDATAGAFFWADVINNNRTGAPTPASSTSVSLHRQSRFRRLPCCLAPHSPG